jgi:ankyrin repeat protein
VLLLLAVLPFAGDARAGVQGPIRGRIELADGAPLDDVVVRLTCHANGLHGSHRTDREQRVVGNGDAYLFLFAWRGISPVGCSLEAMHPLYRQVHVQLSDAFWQSPEPIRLEPWEGLLDAPTDDLSMASLHRHIFYLRHYYLEGLGRDAMRAARYIPELHRIFARSLDVLPPMSSDRFGSRESALDDLRDIETAVGYARPKAQRALFAAASAGDPKHIADAIAGGAESGAWNRDGRAAIHLAAEAGHSAAVLALVDAGANIDRREEGLGKNALLLAIQQHRTETVLLLLGRGADVTLATNGVTPLSASSHQGTRLEVVHALLAAGAITHARDPRHRSAPLVAASRNGGTAIVEALLAQGVAVDAGLPGWTGLMAASRMGKLATARFLIEAGADVDARTADGRTALSLAREFERDPLIELLRANGAHEVLVPGRGSATPPNAKPAPRPATRSTTR